MRGASYDLIRSSGGQFRVVGRATVDLRSDGGSAALAACRCGCLAVCVEELAAARGGTVAALHP